MDWLPIIIAIAAVALFGLGWFASSRVPPSRRRKSDGDSDGAFVVTSGSSGRSRRDNDSNDSSDSGDGGGGGGGGGH